LHSEDVCSLEEVEGGIPGLGSEKVMFWLLASYKKLLLLLKKMLSTTWFAFLSEPSLKLVELLLSKFLFHTSKITFSFLSLLQKEMLHYRE